MRKKQLLVQVLKDQLEVIQKKNPKFSLRAYAKMLHVSPASLSRLLSGKGNPSEKLIKDVIGKLHIDEQTRGQLAQTEYDPYLQPADDNDLQMFIENWYYSPIVCLADTKDFDENPKSIAKRLGINEKDAKQAL